MSYLNLDQSAKARLHRILLDAIDATFSYSDWIELANHTGTLDIVQGHNRLLRSLEFNDDDYRGNILQVLPKIINAGIENLRIILDYGNIAETIRAKHPTFDLEAVLTTGIPVFQPEYQIALQSLKSALEDTRKFISEGRSKTVRSIESTPPYMDMLVL